MCWTFTPHNYSSYQSAEGLLNFNKLNEGGRMTVALDQEPVHIQYTFLYENREEFKGGPLRFLVRNLNMNMSISAEAVRLRPPPQNLPQFAPVSPAPSLVQSHFGNLGQQQAQQPMYLESQKPPGLTQAQSHSFHHPYQPAEQQMKTTASAFKPRVKDQRSPSVPQIQVVSMSTPGSKTMTQYANFQQAVKNPIPEQRSNSVNINQPIPAEDLEEQSEKNIYEYKGKIGEMAKQQQGSKYLQRVMAKAIPEVIDFIINEVGPHLSSLMTDAYGNYFCQKLLQSSSSQQRLHLVSLIAVSIIKISCDKRGTHSMQSLIEMINLPEEEDILRDSLINDIMFLAQEQHGTHVLQKIIMCVKEEKLDYIYEPVFDNLIMLAVDPNGLCVVKKLIQKMTKQPKRNDLVNTISENCVMLVQNPYGNYAVQQSLEVSKIIQSWTNDECNRIYEGLLNNILQLSMQKFSSNVIEKCLEKAPKVINLHQDIVYKFLHRLQESEVMKSLIKNNYGFYVIHKILDVLGDDVRAELAQEIDKNIMYVSDKNLRQKWINLIHFGQNQQIVDY